MKIELIGSLFIYMACIVYKRSKWQSLSLFLLASLAIVPFSIPIALGMICFFFGFVYSAFNITYKNNYVGLVLLIIGLYFAGVHNDSVSYSWVTKLLGYRSYMFLNFLSGIFIVYGVLTSHSLSRMLENKGLVYLGKLVPYLYHPHAHDHFDDLFDPRFCDGVRRQYAERFGYRDRRHFAARAVCGAGR